MRILQTKQTKPLVAPCVVGYEDNKKCDNVQMTRVALTEPSA